MADKDSGTEIFDCVTCDRPESHCEMCPKQDQPEHLEAGSLYLEMFMWLRDFHVPPYPGGSLDQPRHIRRRMNLVKSLIAEKEPSGEEE